MKMKTEFRPLTLQTNAANDVHAGDCSPSTKNEFIPLAQETRTVVDTNTAAFHLGRKPQTLRKWACHEDGPLRPVRIMGRLAWSVVALKRLCSEGSGE